MFLAEGKNPYPFTYNISRGSIEYLIFIRCKATSVRYTRIFHLITIVKFILSSISNG